MAQADSFNFLFPLIFQQKNFLTNKSIYYIVVITIEYKGGILRQNGLPDCFVELNGGNICEKGGLDV